MWQHLESVERRKNVNLEIFQLWSQNESLFFRETKERIYHQQTHIIRNVERCSLVRKKMIPGDTCIYTKECKVTGMVDIK